MVYTNSIIYVISFFQFKILSNTFTSLYHCEMVWIKKHSTTVFTFCNGTANISIILPFVFLLCFISLLASNFCFQIQFQVTNHLQNSYAYVLFEKVSPTQTVTRHSYVSFYTFFKFKFWYIYILIQRLLKATVITIF